MKVIEVLKTREYSLNEITEYYYKIIESEVTIENVGKVEKNLVYGVEVDKILIKKDGNQIIDSEKVEIVSCNLQLVREICKILCENLVSPIHLIDVLEDNMNRILKLDSKVKFVENVILN